MPTRTPPSALEKALRALSVRAYSEAELTARLLKAGYPPDETEAAVSECVKRRYINDELLAEDCTLMWQERGHGSRSIRYKLRQRGVPTEIAAAALADAAKNEEMAAISAISSRLPTLLREKDLRKRKAKAMRFLAARGFAGDAMRAAMSRLHAVAEHADDREENY